MSIKLDCCLCCTPGSAYKLLQNESGEINEIYEITVKYFDPKLLTVHANTFSKETQALCQDCWLHIKDFHEFQLTILKTHTVLEDTKVELLSLVLKVEEEQVTEQSIANELYEIKEELNHVEDVFKCELEDNYGLKESNSTSENYDSEENDDDIKPLIELKELPKSITKLKSSKITKADENPKLSGDRKPITLLTDYTITEKCDETSGNPLRKTKKPKDARKQTVNIKLSTALEKIREYDEFIAKWKPFLECDLCNETFNIFDLLKNHFKDKQNSRCYISCERKFYCRSLLVDYLRLHITPEIYKCEIYGVKLVPPNIISNFISN